MDANFLPLEGKYMYLVVLGFELKALALHLCHAPALFGLFILA
jgi:hypothetical protein